jgi:hypothetical protein
MKCIECPNWDKKKKKCKFALDSVPTLAPTDQDLHCSVVDDKEGYFATHKIKPAEEK